MNNGYSSKLIYDDRAYLDRTKERTDPLLYRLDPNYVFNNEQCFTPFGPRTGRMGVESSTAIGHPVATAQYLTDIESILSNRNVPQSKTKNGEINPIDVNRIGLKHLRTCNTDFLDPMTSHLMFPPYALKETPINRFHDLPTNPQEPIFYDFRVNTKLESKDNHKYDIKNLSAHLAANTGYVMGDAVFTGCGNRKVAKCPQ